MWKSKEGEPEFIVIRMQYRNIQRDNLINYENELTNFVIK